MERVVALALAALLAGCGARSELAAPGGDGDGGAGGEAPRERSCLPNCSVGHVCCQGGCDGPTVPLESACCECLSGEVSSADCPGSKCGGDP